MDHERNLMFARDVSIIVPIEYHRGQGLECIERWACRQDYPRERYQLILAVPDSLSPAVIERLCGYLQPWDRLDIHPFDHDMPLVASLGRHKLSRSVVPFSAPGDSRLPGLPLLGMSWRFAETHKEPVHLLS